MTDSPLLTIFVLARDRLSLLQETLTSITNQDSATFRVTISDNSVGAEVGRMVAKRFPQFGYVRRRPELGVLDHLNAVLAEVETRYFVMFHDDDIMLPSYVSTLLREAAEIGHFAAIACNAYMLNGNTPSKRLTFHSRARQLRFTEPESIFARYCDVDTNIAPFPSYLYSAQALGSLRVDPSKGGKHADLAFLMDVSCCGPIVWLNLPLLYYRRHSGNDSAVVHTGDRLRLLRYVYRATTFDRRAPEVMRYRLVFWAQWLRSPVSKRLSALWRIHVIRRFVLIYGMKQALRQPRIFLSYLIRRSAARFVNLALGRH